MTSVGDKLWYIAGGPLISHYSPCEIIRVTPKQVVVRLPNGASYRFWRGSNMIVGGRNTYLRGAQPEDGPHMRLSNQALPQGERVTA